MEVKNRLQSSANKNSVVPSKPIGLRSVVKSALAASGDPVIKKEAAAVAQSPRNSVTESAASDSDKLPEFKRIVERREEWESRAKMWK